MSGTPMVFPYPQFVIFGGMVGGRVMLCGSDELDQIELEAFWNDHDVDPFRPLTGRVALNRIELRGRMRSVHVVWADSFPAAMQTLAAQWEPIERPRRELAP